MIKVLKPSPGAFLRPEIDRLIEEFGRTDVLRAALGAMIRRRAVVMDAGDLSAHLRRDIGLPSDAPLRDWRLLR